MKFKRLHINIERQIFLEDRTIGVMKVAREYLDTDLKTWRAHEYDPKGNVLGYTMEPAVRKGTKVPGKTAIPTGTYDCVVSFSKKFQKPLPFVANVPGFSTVRIRGGNAPGDSSGDILAAKNFDPKSNVIYGNVTSSIIEHMMEYYGEAVVTIDNKR